MLTPRARCHPPLARLSGDAPSYVSRNEPAWNRTRAVVNNLSIVFEPVANTAKGSLSAMKENDPVPRQVRNPHLYLPAVDGAPPTPAYLSGDGRQGCSVAMHAKADPLCTK